MSSLQVKVCKVDKIEKHPNADKLSIVTIKGWNSIVGLDQYKPGDLVVFIPPDCVIPPALIDFYKLEYLKKNGRTGTVKLRGALSQGLVLDVPAGYEEGEDVADVLGIIKYEVPEPVFYMQAKQVSKKKINPFFDKYTDIENTNNYPDVFREGEEVVITEKIHGTNARYGNLPLVISRNQPWFERLSLWFKKIILGHKYEFVYGSHNVQLYGRKGNFYGEDKWGQIAKKYNLNKVIPPGVIVYGEIYGAGIQDLTYGMTKDIRMVVFDIKSIGLGAHINWDGSYFSWDEFLAACTVFNFPTAPVLYRGKYLKGMEKEYATGQSLLYETQMREGCVIKSVLEENHPMIGRKILKAINPEYLTRKGGTEYK